MKRPYILPNGQVAIGFIDFDGTIAKCQPHFDEAAELFARFMSVLGFDRKESISALRELDTHNISSNGFEIDRLGISMEQAYRQLCKQNGRRANQQDVKICLELGGTPFYKKPIDFKHALKVLDNFHQDHYLVLVTIGDQDAQEFKAKELGLFSTFDRIIVTPESNKDVLVKEFIDDAGGDPHFSFFLGNSKKSDGIALKHTNFIHLPLEVTDVLDNAELPQDTGFTTYTARNWIEAKSRGVDRIRTKRFFAFQ